MNSIEEQSPSTVEIEEILGSRPAPPSIGEIVKWGLKNRNISPEQFSRDTGLSSNEVAQIFSEKARMTPQLYAQIAPVFPSLRDYFFDVQARRDYYDQTGFHMPHNPVAKKALAVYAKIMRG